MQVLPCYRRGRDAAAPPPPARCDPLPSGRIPQYGQGVRVAVHVVVADVKGDGDGDVPRALLLLQWHKATERALVAEVL